MKSIETHVRNFLDLSRGHRESAEEVLHVLALLVLIKKNDKHQYLDLFKSAPNQQRDKFKELVNELKKREIVGKLEITALNLFNDGLFSKAIYLINDVAEADFSTFSVCIRNVLLEIESYQNNSISTNTVADLFSKLVGDVSSETIIYDGAAGYANIVSKIEQAKFQVEEINEPVAELSKILLLLQDKEVTFKVTNSLFNPSFIKTNKKADIAVMTPPMRIRFSAEERSMLTNKGYIVVHSDKPVPTSASDTLWVQQALANVNDKGKVMILLPQGWLFRGGYDAKVREYLLNNDWVESVIHLPSRILKNVMLAPVLVILNKNKEVPGEVKFIDATAFAQKDGRNVSISPDNIQLIAELVQGKHPEHKAYQSVLLPDVIKNNGTLNVGHYIKQESTWTPPDLGQEMIKLGNCMTDFDVAQKKLTKLLSE